LEPEVKVPEEPGGDLNTELLDKMSTYDRIYVAGQAKSHCVLETVTSIAEGPNSGLIQKVYLLTDCMSSVAHPDIDFESMANDAIERFTKQGLQQAHAADPVDIDRS
jgi:nicotinamidase-related amidase